MKLDPGDIPELAPFIREVVRSVLDEIEHDGAKLPEGRIGFSEVEAAGLLGIRPHILRDARQRGLVSAVRIGKAYCYSRKTLLDFVNGAPRNGAKKRQ